ncbi:hypothetical protein CXG81DRAFT_24916 [Caulochytrium protostelioides]|uniref:non-specific serine/threonine protein kinase n=1 Tax=Caulochytrium protostelioides TaxID=1555241 RepID=A0A4P9XAT5_9FUNG|nr:hypothetical protein CXG81DRAFT_24916 [Caulochytrium protostelioides]|eukprot:RKP02456.1 hypothetical protein CXG81DRAFT_24916 [Caulochytrium protostelioides]
MTRIHREVALLRAAAAATTTTAGTGAAGAAARPPTGAASITQLRELIHAPYANRIYLVLDYASGGEIVWQRAADTSSPALGRVDAAHHLQQARPVLTPREVLVIARDVTAGLAHLHACGIVHRDVKPANLIWATPAREAVKIVDLGVGTRFWIPGCWGGLDTPSLSSSSSSGASSAPSAADSDSKALEAAWALYDEEYPPLWPNARSELARTVGTPAFLAPELCGYGMPPFDATASASGRVADVSAVPELRVTGPALDTWSWGVTLYCLVFGCIPFAARSEFELFRVICTNTPSYTGPTVVTEARHRAYAGHRAPTPARFFFDSDASDADGHGYDGTTTAKPPRDPPPSGRLAVDPTLEVEASAIDALIAVLPRLLVKHPQLRASVIDVAHVIADFGAVLESSALTSSAASGDSSSKQRGASVDSVGTFVPAEWTRDVVVACQKARALDAQMVTAGMGTWPWRHLGRSTASTTPGAASVPALPYAIPRAPSRRSSAVSTASHPPPPPDAPAGPGDGDDDPPNDAEAGDASDGGEQEEQARRAAWYQQHPPL